MTSIDLLSEWFCVISYWFIHRLKVFLYFQTLGEQLVNLIGDVLIAAACMAYLGAFTSSYREELTSLWTNQLNQLLIPASPTFRFYFYFTLPSFHPKLT